MKQQQNTQSPGSTTDSEGALEQQVTTSAKQLRTYPCTRDALPTMDADDHNAKAFEEEKYGGICGSYYK